MNASERMRCRSLIASARAHARAVRDEAGRRRAWRTQTDADRRATGILEDAARGLEHAAEIVESMVDGVKKARPRAKRAA